MVTTVETQSEKLSLLQKWNEAKTQLKNWQEQESTLRESVVKEFFGCEKLEGTETQTLEGNWKLKVVRHQNYNLNNTDGKVAIICAQLPDIISRSLVTWKPDLNIANWRKVDFPTQELFKDVLVIKPGKPSLELIPPES